MLLISAHYVESIIKSKRNIHGIIKDEKICLRGYKWVQNYECPFTDRKGAYVKVRKYGKRKYHDAFFII